MRLLFLSERYPPYYTGGYEIACEAVAEGLRRRGHEASILTSNYGLTTARRKQENVFRLLHYRQNSSSLIQLGCWELSDARTVRSLVASLSPDVVYAWSLFHLFPSVHSILRTLHPPIVFNIQDVWLPRHLIEAECWRTLWLKPGTSLARRLAKVAVRKALQWWDPTWLRPLTLNDLSLDNVVFCSRFRQAEHERLGLPASNSQVIYNGIDTACFTGTLVNENRLPLKVLFVGRLVEEKGAHIAVGAIAELRRRGCREVMLSIAGAPSHPWDYAAKLQVKVEAEGLGDYVRFLGMVVHDALPEVYRQHHVLVFPSTINEGLPVTLLEAMATGLTVVGTTTGGSNEILENEVNALTFAPGDAMGLADRLLRLLHDVTLSRSLAAAGQQLVRAKFGIESVVAQTEDYLRDVINNHAVHPGSRRPVAVLNKNAIGKAFSDQEDKRGGSRTCL